MKTIIAGSRNVKFFPPWKWVVENLLSGIVPSEIISGGAKGADAMGEKWARANAIPLKIFPAEWDKHGKSAGYKRNVQMAEYVGKDGRLLAFWDGESKGTKHMIDIAKKHGLEVVIFEALKDDEE